MDNCRKEARIIVPQTDNDGISLKWLQSQFEDKIVSKFGGFTLQEAQGGWHSIQTRKTYLEAVWLYDLAVEDNKQVESELIAIAARLKKEGRQEAIYLRLPAGKVVYI